MIPVESFNLKRLVERHLRKSIGESRRNNRNVRPTVDEEGKNFRVVQRRDKVFSTADDGTADRWELICIFMDGQIEFICILATLFSSSPLPPSPSPSSLLLLRLQADHRRPAVSALRQLAKAALSIIFSRFWDRFCQIRRRRRQTTGQSRHLRLKSLILLPQRAAPTTSSASRSAPTSCCRSRLLLALLLELLLRVLLQLLLLLRLRWWRLWLRLWPCRSARRRNCRRR